MELIKQIKKTDLQDLETFLAQIDFNANNADLISPVHANELFTELEVYCGESLPEYFTLPSAVFVHYASEYFENEVLPYIKNDAEFNDALKQMQFEEMPIIFWYREVADKRDRLECSKYFAHNFLADLSNEIIFN